MDNLDPSSWSPLWRRQWSPIRCQTICLCAILAKLTCHDSVEQWFNIMSHCSCLSRIKSRQKVDWYAWTFWKPWMLKMQNFWTLGCQEGNMLRSIRTILISMIILRLIVLMWLEGNKIHKVIRGRVLSQDRSLSGDHQPLHLGFSSLTHRWSCPGKWQWWTPWMEAQLMSIFV